VYFISLVVLSCECQLYLTVFNLAITAAVAHHRQIRIFLTFHLYVTSHPITGHRLQLFAPKNNVGFVCLWFAMKLVIELLVTRLTFCNVTWCIYCSQQWNLMTEHTITLAVLHSARIRLNRIIYSQQCCSVNDIKIKKKLKWILCNSFHSIQSTQTEICRQINGNLNATNDMTGKKRVKKQIK